MLGVYWKFPACIPQLDIKQIHILKKINEMSYNEILFHNHFTRSKFLMRMLMEKSTCINIQIKSPE